MVTDSYDYLTSTDKTLYYFESEGNQGKIIKVILFAPYKGKLWSLGFGDLQGEQINDSIVSNNHDIVKVMNTIAEIIYEFTTVFPARNIRIKPVDEKRKRLYNHVFRRNYEDINVNFHIIGVINGKKKVYSPKIIYDSFELKRRFV